MVVDPAVSTSVKTAPKAAVVACRLVPGMKKLTSVTVLPTALSLGRRPTFYDQAHASLLECHVLDFSGDLYDEHVRVRFVERLRGEEKFESIEALVAQMNKDCDEARRILAAAEPPSSP